MFKSGDRIGKYTLIREIGEGSFGTVWLAEDAQSEHPEQVAIKLLKHPDSNAIIEEVFLWARLGDHENVLPIIEAKAYKTKDGDIPAIITPYIPDGSLADEIDSRSFSLDSALDFACGILNGLAHLHGKGIVHRDLKPANILVYQGAPLIGDFGIARLVESGNNSSAIMGTPLYMAPEAFLGKRTFQTDLWSASIICYQLFTGRLPFTDIEAIRGDDRPPPFPGSVPMQIQQALFAALRKNPALRSFKSASNLRDALSNAMRAGDGNRPVKSADQLSTPPAVQRQASESKPPLTGEPNQPVTAANKKLVFRGDDVEAKRGTFANRLSKKKNAGTKEVDHLEVEIKKGKFDDLRVFNDGEE
jgi:serine/threonine-protein kinase